MIRLLVKTSYFAMLFFILLAGILICLLSTEPGLETLIQFSPLYVPGKIKIHQIKGNLLHDFTLEKVEYQNNAIKIKINQLKVQWHPSTSWKNHFLTAQWSDLQGEFSKENKLNSTTGTITATTTLAHVDLSLNALIDTGVNEHWQMKTLVQGTYPWQWTVDARLSQAQNDTAKQPGLHANLSVRGVTKSNHQGYLVLTLHPGYYQAPKNYSFPDLQFKGGTINMELSAQQLSGNGSLAIDLNKNLKLEFLLPRFSLNTGFTTNQSIRSKFSLEINSLDFLQNISPEISKLQGQLVALLSVKGTLGKPQIESKLMLSKTSFYLPKLGLNLDSLDLTILSKEKKWDATGTLMSAGHPLQLKGNGNLNSNYNGDLLLEGSDFPLINTSEYKINISPKLKLHFTRDVHDISGSILIPDAQIKPQSFTNSVSLPDEVVYKKQNEQSSSPLFNGNLNINIEMGKNVELNVKGLKGHIDGLLNVKQQSQGAMNAYGELVVRDGTYKAYGQDLAIQQGQLIFTGGPITNPGISLRAAKKINNSSTYTNATQLFDFNNNDLQNVSLGDNITLGVEVTGRLTSPKIQLFSDPAILSQADILSMLVLGRPASQANKAGAQLLLTAISSMNVAGTNSSQLLEQLKQNAGLDFNVQTNTNYNQVTNTVSDSTAFVVGKSLSKRLYLSYNIGLSQTDANVLTLKYLLNKFFSIQINNSTNSNGIDILYTAHKKK